jgi:hypothetical protein
MNDESQDSQSDRLSQELSEAMDEFRVEIDRVTRVWGFWTGHGNRIIGPYNATQVASIYRIILLALFVVGVILSVVNHGTGGLGVALVVGSIFAFGAWMAQAWYLSREEELRLRNELLGGLMERDLRKYASRCKDIAKRIDELDKSRPDETDRQ